MSRDPAEGQAMSETTSRSHSKRMAFYPVTGYDPIFVSRYMAVDYHKL